MMPPSLGNSGAEPIDLTGTDNEDELPRPGAKRARGNSPSAAYIPHIATADEHLLAPRHPNHINIQNLSSLSQPLSGEAPWATPFAPHALHARAWGSQPTPGQIQQQLAALSRVTPYALPFARTPHVTNAPPQSQFARPSPAIIDLTRETTTPSPSPTPQPFFLTQSLVLDDSFSPTTAILIGQINVQALVLNPVPYIIQHPTHTVLPNGQVLSAAGQDYVPVKLRITTDDPDAHDILIYTPSQLRNGSSVAPDNFAVVEKKVSARLQPLMSKRAIKLEAMIKTVQNGSNVCILRLHERGKCLDFQILVASLVVLVFTAKGNVSQIAEALLKYGLILERPGIMWKNVLNSDNLIYHNPHEGHAPLPATPSASASRWSSPAISSKSVEVQRGAADAVSRTYEERKICLKHRRVTIFFCFNERITKLAKVSIFPLRFIHIKERPFHFCWSANKSSLSMGPGRPPRYGTATVAIGRIW